VVLTGIVKDDDLKQGREGRDERLDVVRQEVDIQRGLQATRESSLQTRLAILVGGAGVGLTLMAGGRLNWASVTAGLFALVAASTGVAAMTAVKATGVEVSLAKAWEVLNSAEPPDVYSLQYRLVADKITAHECDNGRYRARARAAQAGFAVLVLSWLVGAVSYLI
jgi:hypothetical protein